MGWSITPTAGGASIDQEGNAYFPKNESSSSVEYTIVYVDSDGYSGETTCTIPACGRQDYRWVNDDNEYICDDTTHSKYHREKKQISTDGGSTWTDVSPKDTRRGSLWESCSSDCGCISCTCANANVQLGTTSISLAYKKNTVGSTAETTFTHSCNVSINDSACNTWLSVTEEQGKLKFKVTKNLTSKIESNVYIDDSDGNHCKTINVVACKTPSAKVNLEIGKGYLAGGYDYFVLTDAEITDNYKAWINSSGAKLHGDYHTNPIRLGYYQYSNCEFSEYNAGTTGYYNSFPSCTKKKLTPSVYYFYGHVGSNDVFIKLLRLEFPTTDYALDHCNPLDGEYRYNLIPPV